MANSNQPWAKCKSCGKELSLEHEGACPDCGHTEKETFLAIGIASEIDEALPLSWIKVIRESRKIRPVLTSIWVAVTVGSPFVGLFLAGWPGVLVGLVFATAGTIVGLHAITKEREIERGDGA